MERKIKAMKLLRPKLIRGLEGMEMESFEIEDESRIENMNISAISMRFEDPAKVSFEGSIFNKVDFSNIALEGLEVTDVIFKNCDFSNSNLTGAIIHRTEFIGCKLIGIDLRDATLNNVLIDNCNGRFALMNYIRMKNIKIVDSMFESCNLQYGELSNFEMKKTNFRSSQMSGTNLSGMDLSECFFEGVGIGPEDVKGAIIDPMQAVDFAKIFGLKIK